MTHLRLAAHQPDVKTFLAHLTGTITSTGITFVAGAAIAVLTVLGPSMTTDLTPVSGQMDTTAAAVSTTDTNLVDENGKLTGSKTTSSSEPVQRKLPASGQFTDASEKKAAVDITDVYFSAASKAEPAAVSVFTNDTFEVGDSFAVTLNIDSDAAPDVLITGMYASEYGAYLLKDWGNTGKDVTGKNCARMSIDGKYADVSFSPNCFTGKTVKSFSANVRTLGDGGSDDYAPGFQKFTKKIDANI